MNRWLARRRQTASLCVRSPALLRALIQRTQHGRFGPFITPQTFELGSGPGEFASARAEYEDGERFFEHFPGLLAQRDLAGLEVLDLGCGYGGRTVYYAADCAAAHVWGNEITEGVVERCIGFADSRAVTNVTFDVARAEALPYPSDRFDAVLSFDVLEHVQDPRATLHEIARVLRPGGRAWLVFPTYLSALASHLDYLTRLPALHRIFDPDVLIDVVNEFLTRHPDRYGTHPQPRPTVGAMGRIVLPQLNGMSWAEADAIVESTQLRIEHSELAPLVGETTPVPGARLAAMALRAWASIRPLPELLVAHIRLQLVK